MSQTRRSDLISVGADGTLRLLSDDVREHLAAHAGHYQLLPSPRKVMLLRAVGTDGSASVRIRLAGEISTPGGICEVFALIAQAGWRGELVVSEVGSTRSLFFERGSVVGAETTVAQERLGHVMYRYGMLSEQERRRVAAQVKHGGRFGSASVELGIVSQEAVYRSLRYQIEDIAFATFAVSEGTFAFFDDFDPSRLVSLQLVSAQRLLMDGVTRMDEIRYFREKIPTADHVPVRDAAKGPPPEEYATTYEAIDGMRSIQDLGRLTGRGEFAITKDVYGLVTSGHVVVRPPLPTGGLGALVELANEAMRLVHREAAGAGKCIELSRSLESFMSDPGTYDVLFQDAGVAAEGSLDAAQVAKNLERFPNEEPETFLRQMLYEYASFAVFSLGASLGPAKEADIRSRLDETLTRLKPASPKPRNTRRGIRAQR